MNEPRVVESVTNECQLLGRAHESSSARAEQLIACLEGEIAKRDARIVELERYDEAVEREAFEAWHKERYPAVKIRVQNLLGTYTDMQVECNFETWLACAESHSNRFGGALLDANSRLNGPPVSEAKAQGVVMPERKTKADYGVYIDEFADEAAAIYNAALDAVARLNAAPAAPAAAACKACKGTGRRPIGGRGKIFGLTNRCFECHPVTAAEFYGVGDDQ